MAPRAHIQFMTSSSVALGGRPRCADQINRSNEVTRTTPQRATMLSASTSTRVPDVLEKVLAKEAIHRLQPQPQGLRPIWHW